MNQLPMAGEDWNTPLAPEDEAALRPSVSSRAELNEMERQNINEADRWAMRRPVLRRRDLLSDGFARELHRRMFRHVWKWAGQYRNTGRNLGWEPHRLSEGMRILFDDAAYWIAAGTYPYDEAAIRLHHRLVLIHPWPNGNGRHARLIANVLLESLGQPRLPWGGSRQDLQIMNTLRERYISALRQADAGDFHALLAFCRS